MTKPPPIWIRDVNVLMPVEYRDRNFTLSMLQNKTMESLYVHYSNRMRVTSSVIRELGWRSVESARLPLTRTGFDSRPLPYVG